MKEDNSLKKNTILLTAGSILNKGFQFVTILFFSRWLSAEEYGRFDLLYTYISLFIPVITLSTHEAVFRYTVDEPDINVRRSNITNGFMIDLINFCLIVFLSSFLWSKIDKNLYLCFMLYLFAELFSVYLKGYLRAVKRLDIYSFSMLLTTLFMAALVTLFVYVLGWGLKGILAGYGIGTLLGDVVLCIWGKWISILRFGSCRIERMKNLIRYSIPLVPNDISWWIMNASDRQIINLYYGDGANGIYAIAHKIPALCSTVFGTFGISWQQEIIMRIHDPYRNAYINQVFNRLLIVLLTACSGLLAGSFILYYYFFDHKYFAAAKYSPVLISAVAFMTVSVFLGGIQIALKKPKQSGVTTITGAALNVMAHMLLIPLAGLYAAGISTLVANATVALLRLVMLKDVFTIKIEKKAMLAALGFFYFFAVSYFHTYLLFNIGNLILAVLFFTVMNKDMILNLICRKI